MASFATDQVIAPTDLQLLRGVARGQKHQLSRAVERFCPVLEAMSYRRTKNLAMAERFARTYARQLFTGLLTNSLKPEDFPHAAVALVESESTSGDGASGPGELALHSLHSAAKLIRRRAAAAALHQLSANECIAMILQYRAGWTPDQMVGIVGETMEQVRDILINAHRFVVEFMRSQTQSAG